MDDVLLGLVLQRLKESPLEERETNLLLAAFESEESLSAQLDGQAAARPSGDRAVAALAEPAGAYLRSFTVSGFRGIGKPAALSLQPSPGLTVVVGRNGSGKFGFAEALEVLLTGELRRWEKLSAAWRQDWRSMHQPDHAEITAEFLVQDAEPTVVQRTWPDGADFAGSSVFAQVAAGEKRAGLEQLGWSVALADHRPFLVHGELEAFFGSPSGPYELLASVLGLEDLTSAARLAQARLARDAALKAVKKSLPGLPVLLEDAGDDRAGVCLGALGGRTWDLVAARRAATGVQVAADGGELDRLRRLAQLAALAEDDVRDAAAALRDAASGLDAVAGSPAGRARALAGLLTAALHHEAHGDGHCPVCGVGALTGQWR
jgi:hypothetical protein